MTKTADLSLAGRILKEAREKLNLRLEDFALALSKEGVVGPTGTPYSLGTVSRWLAGQVEPPFNVIATAARLAGVSIDQHIRADAPGEIETTPDQVRRIVREALGETNYLIQETAEAAKEHNEELRKHREQLAKLTDDVERLRAERDERPPEPGTTD